MKWAWWVAVHGVARSRTRLSDFTFTFMHWRRKWQPTRVLAWRIPGMGEPGGLPSVGSHRVGHGWSDLAAAAAGPGRRREWGVLMGIYVFFFSQWIMMKIFCNSIVEMIAQLCQYTKKKLEFHTLRCWILLFSSWKHQMADDAGSAEGPGGPGGPGTGRPRWLPRRLR